jgi:hypothetical protein
VFEDRAELVLEWRDLRLQVGSVVVGLVGLPGFEEGVGDHEPCVAEVFLFAHAFAVGGEVPEQVGPAELSLAGVEVVVASPPVRADDPGEPLAEERPGLEGVATGRDPEHRGAAGVPRA